MRIYFKIQMADPLDIQCYTIYEVFFIFQMLEGFLKSPPSVLSKIHINYYTYAHHRLPPKN